MKLGLVEGSAFLEFAPVGDDFPVSAPLAWEQVPDDTTLEWTWDGTQAVAPPPQTFDEALQEKKDELKQIIRTVLSQGVDGPQGLGEASLGARSWPTDTTAWTNLLLTIEGKGDNSLSVPYIFQTLKDFDTGFNGQGDIAGLGEAGTNNTIGDLRTAMYVQRQTTATNAKTKWQDIKAATTIAELDAIDLETGWPAEPVNP